MNLIKLRLLGDGRRGYRQIVKFSTVWFNKGNLIIDCPICNDAQVLLQQFGSDLYLIARATKNRRNHSFLEQMEKRFTNRTQ